MKNFTLKNKLPLIFSAILCSGLTANANAGAVAYSYLEIDDFRLFNDTTGAQLDVSDFSFLDIGESSTASATSSFGPGAVTSNPVGLDTTLACSGVAGCVGIAPNDKLQQVAKTNFGRGDTSAIDGAIITGTGAAFDFANVWTVAEGRQSGTGFTTGDANVSNATEFVFEFMLGGAGDIDVRMDFMAFAELYVKLDQDSDKAFASYDWSLTIEDVLTGVIVFDWTPNGSPTGSELADAFDLSDERSVLNTGTAGTGPLGGFFSNVVTLTRGTDLRLSINADSSITTRIEEVPEPGALFLMGAGLLGLRLTRRFRITS